MEADYLSWGWLVPKWHLLHHIAQAAFHLWSQPDVDLLASSLANQCQCYYCLESLLPLCTLWLSAFNCPRHMSDKVFVSSPSFISPGSIQVPGRINHISVQSTYSSGTLFDGGFLASHISQHIGRHSSLVSHHKGPCHGCLSELSAQGSVIAVFIPLVADRRVCNRQGFPSSVCQAVMWAKDYQQHWKEWTESYAWEGLPKGHFCL